VPATFSPQKSGQALNRPRTQIRLFLVQGRANKQRTIGGNLLPPMESDNVLSHSKAIALFLYPFISPGKREVFWGSTIGAACFNSAYALNPS
jgi:hypothetical protein